LPDVDVRAGGRRHGDAERGRLQENRALTPRRVAEFEGAVERYLDELLAPLAETGAADLYRPPALARTLPLMMICDLLAVPEQDAAGAPSRSRCSTRTPRRLHSATPSPARSKSAGARRGRAIWSARYSAPRASG
jgi:cytochrome P450